MQPAAVAATKRHLALAIQNTLIFFIFGQLTEE